VFVTGKRFCVARDKRGMKGFSGKNRDGRGSGRDRTARLSASMLPSRGRGKTVIAWSEGGERVPEERREEEGSKKKEKSFWAARTSGEEKKKLRTGEEKQISKGRKGA